MIEASFGGQQVLVQTVAIRVAVPIRETAFPAHGQVPRNFVGGEVLAIRVALLEAQIPSKLSRFLAEFGIGGAGGCNVGAWISDGIGHVHQLIEDLPFQIVLLPFRDAGAAFRTDFPRPVHNLRIVFIVVG